MERAPGPDLAVHFTFHAPWIASVQRLHVSGRITGCGGESTS